MTELLRKRYKREIHCVQHQLYTHEDHDSVPACKHTRHTDSEQDRAE